MWAVIPVLLLLATDYTTEGMKALEDRKYQEAASLFAKAVAADPGDYAANFIWRCRIACSTSPRKPYPSTKKYWS